MTTSTIEQTANRQVNVDQTPPVMMIVYDSVQGKWFPVDSASGVIKVSGGGGGGGGGGLVQIDQTTPGTTNGVSVTNWNLGRSWVLDFTTDDVGAVQVGSWSVGINNFPATQAVSGTVALAAGAAAIGSVSVSNFPATQPVSGSVSLAAGVNAIGSVSVTGSVAVTGTFWQATQPVSGTVVLGAGAAAIGSVTVSNFPATQAVSGTVTDNQGTPAATANAWPIKVTDGTNVAAVKAASTAAAAADPAAVVSVSPNSPAYKRAADLAVTTTAAANTAVTLTLPAAAGLFHYITRIEITRVATAALAGSATLGITTTNLPGTLAWTVGNAMAAGGTSKDVDINFSHPIKSSVINTATTIVCPAPGAAVLWRVTAHYYTAP